MDDTLQILIRELETEKSNLLQLIDNAVKEEEYLHAHFHFEALGQINGQLQTLKNLDDELYDKKYRLESGIENLKKLIKTESSKFESARHHLIIKEREKELHDLNQIPRQNIKAESNHLKNYLDQINKNKIRGIRINFTKSDILVLDITKTKEGIKITMSNIKKIKKEYLFHDERQLKLIGLGFLPNSKGDKMIIKLKKKENDLTNKVLTLISIIIFEVFYFKHLGSQATLEILHKKPNDRYNSLD